MEFEVLGRLRVLHAGRDVVLAGRLQGVLLGVLLARRNTVVSAATLSEAMWGEAWNDRAAPNLHVHVHRLRRALPEPDRLTSVAGGYRLDVRQAELDAARFESLLDDGVASDDPRHAAEVIRAALTLWRGVPFDGLDTAVLDDEASRLGERRLAGLVALYGAELAAARHVAVAAELCEVVRAHPLHERLRGLLMLALYRGGQRDAALAAYRSGRRSLVDELGLEPGPELRHIHESIVAGRPVEFDAPVTGAGTPAQLPLDVRGFTGRESELSTMDGLMSSGAPVLISAVSGTGGVGKTALAVRWAYRARARFPDGQLYVDLRGFGPRPPVSPDDALAGFLRELGESAVAIPTECAERAARFRTLVARRRMVVILDNAATAEQVRPLLPGGTTAAVLVTSRDSLAGLVAREGAQRLFLDRLSPSEALGLLREQVGGRVDAEPTAVTSVIDRCARLPLALRIAGELVNSRPHRPIAELADELAENGRTLDVLDAGGDAETALRTVFSWSYQRLPAQAAKAFRFIGLHPGQGVDEHAVAALTDGDLAATRSALLALRRAQLVDETAGGHYRPHDLLRAYADELCRSMDSAADRSAAVARLIEHYLQTAARAAETIHVGSGASSTGFADAEQATRWLETERANLVAITEQSLSAGNPYATTTLAAALRRHLSLGGHHDQALVVNRAALRAAREAGDLVGEGNACRYLGSVQRRLGHLTTGYEHMHRALGCYREAGHERYLHIQLNNLGVTCTWLGRFEEGLGYLRESLALSEELGAAGRIGRVGALTYLGQLHTHRGEPGVAVDYLAQALALADRDCPRERIDGEAIIGMAYDRLGSHGMARRHFERARSIAEQTHNQVIGAYIHQLAHTYWLLGLRDEAFDHAERCLTLVTAANERMLAAGVRNTFGELHRLNGSYADAFEHFNAALEIATASGAPADEANAHTGIGDTHRNKGEKAEARTQWLCALAVQRRVGSADAARTDARLASLSP